MPDFNASLLREKFTMMDAMPNDIRDVAPVIALSNRLVLPLRSDDGNKAETFVIRAQNMHSCARLGAQIAREFQEKGPLLDRIKPYDWADAYASITKGYEKTWNEGRWAAIYSKGRVVFEEGPGARHVFLDIIEQCDARNKGDYARALDVATDAFKQAGKLVTIKHDSNVALVLNIGDEEGKCGVIVRGPSRTTTFNMTARRKAGRAVKPSQCLTAAAAFLEGIQLAFFVGMTKQKLKYELVSASAPEAKQADDAGHKLARLNGAVQQFENLLDVVYRPDRPDFSKLIDDAEEFARKVLRGEIENRARSGDGGWVN